MSVEDRLSDVLPSCYATVSFNSNGGVESVLAGIPTVCQDKGSMAWDVAEKNLGNIEQISLPDRTQWAYNLAYTQWTTKEMEQGLPQIHLGLAI